MNNSEASEGEEDDDAKEKAIVIACKKYVDTSVCRISESEVGLGEGGRVYRKAGMI